MTAVTAVVSAITDKFRAILDLTPRSQAAVNKQLARIYDEAPKMIKATAPRLQDDEVAEVVELLIEWQVSPVGPDTRRFLDNQRYRRGIVYRAVQTWYRDRSRAFKRRAEHENLYREEHDASAALRSPLHVIVHDELDNLVRKALEFMPPLRRAIYEAHVFGQRSHREIAEDFGLEMWQINSQMTSAHDTLREVVRARDEGRSPVFRKRGRPKGRRDSKPRIRGAS